MSRRRLAEVEAFSIREAGDGDVREIAEIHVRSWRAAFATAMIYVHHVPQVDAAEKLSAALRDASAPPLARSAA